MDSVCKFCQRKFTKKYKAQIFCSLLCSNRHNLNNRNQVIISSKHSVDIAEFFGILLGDGSVTKYYSKVYLNAEADVDYAPFVKELATKLFVGASVTYQKRPAEGTLEIQISSKVVCDYLRSLGFDAKKRIIPLWIIKNRDYAKAVVRGLFDTEGSVGIKYFRGKNGNYLYKQLTVTNKNKNILGFLEKYLKIFGYKPTNNSWKNIYISNRLDIEKYFNNIGSHNPKIINKIKIKEIDEFSWRVGRTAMH